MVRLKGLQIRTKLTFIFMFKGQFATSKVSIIKFKKFTKDSKYNEVSFKKNISELKKVSALT